MKTFSRQFACLAVAVMASVASASAAPITVYQHSKFTITDTMVNANVPAGCKDTIYHWWFNGMYTQITTRELTITPYSLPAGTYTYYRTTRCGGGRW
jgi:hypothetical protein